jgi:hypothetical protein
MDYTGVDLTLTLVILAILTAVIFAFAIVAFISIYRNEKTFIAMGQRDKEIKEDKEASKKKSYKVTNILTEVFSYAVIALSIGVMIFSVYFKSQNQMIWNSKGEASMVVASSSMSKTRDASTQTYLSDARTKLQFSRGDILTIKTLPALEELLPDTTTDSEGKTTYVVANDLAIDNAKTYVNDYLYNTAFVYYNKDFGINVIHRLVYIGMSDTSDPNSLYFGFRGDNTTVWDGSTVKYSELKAIYQEPKKVKGIGYAVLFFQDGFGIYSVIASVCMMVISSIFISKIEKARNERYHLLEAVADAAKPDEVPGVNDPDEVPAPKKSLKDADFQTAEKAPTEPVEAVKPVETSPVSPTEPAPSTAAPANPTEPEPTKAVMDEKPKEENIPSGTTVPAAETKQESPSSTTYVKIAKSEGGKN